MLPFTKSPTDFRVVGAVKKNQFIDRLKPFHQDHEVENSRQDHEVENCGFQKILLIKFTMRPPENLVVG